MEEVRFYCPLTVSDAVFQQTPCNALSCMCKWIWAVAVPEVAHPRPVGLGFAWYKGLALGLARLGL
jgi:hypothetical protein